MEKKYTFKIDKSSNGINKFSLNITEELEYIHIDVLIPNNLKYASFIVVEDEKSNIRLQKLLGYGEQRLGIGKTPMVTTIGGVPGGIGIGQWKITLVIFKDYLGRCIGEESINIDINVSDKKENITEPIGEVTWVDGEHGLMVDDENYNMKKLYNSDFRWYKGDFHTHTTLSDGKETVVNAMKKAKDMNLDFYIPTEHNLMHTGWKNSDIMILPGIEITTEDGHCNLFNIKSMPKIVVDMFSSIKEINMEEAIKETVKEAKENNCVVSINHPFLTEWKWRYYNLELKYVDCIEIINDPTYTYAKNSNEKALKFIDLLWEDGHKIWGIGGSDAHNLIEERYEGASEPSIAGDPGTFIFCEGLTPENLLKSVKNGHIYVSRKCTIIPEIIVGNRKYIPGDKIDIDDEEYIDYKVKISNLNEEPLAYAIINNKKVEIPIKCKENMYFAEIRTKFNREQYNWMRVEIRKANGDFLAYVNPIYYGEKESKYNLFGEFVALVEGYIED